MVWDVTKPTAATKIRLLPNEITPNWLGIQGGEVPYDSLKLKKRVANPGTVADHAQLYSIVCGAETELCAINGAGNATQLTSLNVVQVTPQSPVKANPGRVYLPDGVVIQWGYSTFPLALTGTVTFPVGIFSAIYSVVGTCKKDDRTFAITSFNAANFSWKSGNNTIDGINWIAIGAS